jgi:hypothetical protein
LIKSNNFAAEGVERQQTVWRNITWKLTFEIDLSNVDGSECYIAGHNLNVVAMWTITPLTKHVEAGVRPQY